MRDRNRMLPYNKNSRFPPTVPIFVPSVGTLPEMDREEFKN
jgi:hypothetical protein